MTVSPSSVSDALMAFPSDELPDDPTTADHDAYEVVAAAARSWVEGEEVAWCVKHRLPKPFVIENVCAIGYMPLFDPDEDLPCEFVSKRLCDGIDGG